MTTTLVTTSIGHDLLSRLMAGDDRGASALLAPNVHFRGVTPGKFIEIQNSAEAVEQFNAWFKRGWREAIESFEDGDCYGRKSMTYRVRWSDDYGQKFVFEQTVYYEADGSGITWLELMCSGHRPLGAYTL